MFAKVKLFRAPISRHRKGPPRRGPMRDSDYLAWLRSEGVCSPCVMEPHAGRYHVEPAHGPVNGMSSKGPDNECVPLCRVHHTAQHEMGWPKFERKYHMDRAELAARWWALYLEQKEGTDERTAHTG